MLSLNKIGGIPSKGIPPGGIPPGGIPPGGIPSGVQNHIEKWIYLALITKE